MTDRYAVIGNPIGHSLSPRIHAAFAAQTGEDISYTRLLGDIDHVEHDFQQFFASGGRGLNVTVPFKEAACRFADRLSERAGEAGAVNTLIAEATGIHGDNTDGAGLVNDLAGNNGFALADKRILLLGAGGAARGVLRPLLDEAPARLVIANRTAQKAIDLAARATGLADVTGCGLDALQGQQFDLIINATAAGLDAQVPPIPDDCLADGAWTYDMMYGAQPTAFVQWGRGHGAALALDGLGMLVEQAAESFRLWRGVRPDTAGVISALRHEF
ncbi:MAG: shikimate dehydrogenase [Chromatiaceae bacterium]|jgi:shikimate dehydrogenase